MENELKTYLSNITSEQKPGAFCVDKKAGANPFVRTVFAATMALSAVSCSARVAPQEKIGEEVTKAKITEIVPSPTFDPTKKPTYAESVLDSTVVKTKEPTLPTAEEVRNLHFEVGRLDLRSDFSITLAKNKKENAKVVPYLYSDAWTSLQKLFEDWSGKLGDKELKNMFPGTDGKPSYTELSNLLKKWPENSRFLTESQAEPQAGRVTLWGHSGWELFAGPLPFNPLKKAKPGDIEIISQGGTEEHFLVVSTISVPEIEMGNYQGVIGDSNANLLAQDIYSIYLSKLQEDFGQEKINQDESNKEKNNLDTTFSKPGIDFVTCEASDPLNPTNFDKRVIVTTILVPEN